MSETIKDQPIKGELVQIESTAMAITPQNQVQLVPIKEIRDLAKAAFALKLFEVKSEDDAFLRCVAAQELGFKPLIGGAMIYVVKGKLGMESKAMRAILFANGWHFKYRFDVPQERENDATMCGCRLQEPNGNWTEEVIFTMADAEQLGITRDYSGNIKTNWKTQRGNMLLERCTSRICRRFASHLFFGAAYTKNELLEIPENNTNGNAPAPIDVPFTPEQIESSQPKQKMSQDIKPLEIPCTEHFNPLMANNCWLPGHEEIEWKVDKFGTQHELPKVNGEARSWCKFEAALKQTFKPIYEAKGLSGSEVTAYCKKTLGKPWSSLKDNQRLWIAAQVDMMSAEELRAIITPTEIPPVEVEKN